MDRNNIVELNKSVRISNSLSLNEGIELLTHYCIEKGKDPNKTNQFLAILTKTPVFIMYVRKALKYYSKKYEIIELWDKDNNLIQIY